MAASGTLQLTRRRRPRGIGRIELGDRQRLLLVPGVAILSVAVGVGIATGSKLSFILAAVPVVSGLLVVFAELGFDALVWWAVGNAVAYPFLRYPSGSSYITFDRIWFASMVGCLIFLPSHVRRTRASRALLITLVILMLAYTTRVLTTPAHLLQNLKTAVDALILPLIAFAVTSRAAVTEERRARLARWMMIAGTIMALIGLGEKLLGFNLATLSGGDVFIDNTAGAVRISGPYPAAEIYALVLAVCLAASAYWMQLRRAYWVGGALASIQLLALSLTLFRAAWIAAIVTIVASFGLRPKRYGRLFAVGGVVAALLFAAYGQLQQSSVFNSRLNNTTNIFTRFAIYEQGIQIWKTAPAFGVGVNQFPVVAAEMPTVSVGGAKSVPYPHNSYLGALAEEGLFGFVPLVLATIGGWYLLRSFRRVARTREHGLLLGTATGIVLSYMIMSLTLNMLPYGPSNTFFLIWMGVVAAALDAEVWRRRREVAHE